MFIAVTEHMTLSAQKFRKCCVALQLHRQSCRQRPNSQRLTYTSCMYSIERIQTSVSQDRKLQIPCSIRLYPWVGVSHKTSDQEIVQTRWGKNSQPPLSEVCLQRSSFRQNLCWQRSQLLSQNYCGTIGNTPFLRRQPAALRIQTLRTSVKVKVKWSRYAP
jgi:hypothetical protein